MHMPLFLLKFSVLGITYWFLSKEDKDLAFFFSDHLHNLKKNPILYYKD